MRVRDRLKANFEFRKRNKKNEYLLGGKLRCVCGNRMSGNGPLKAKDPSKEKHLYYRCIDRILRYPLPRVCNERGVNAVIVDKLVWFRLFEFATSPELLLEQATRWINNHQDGAKASIENVAEIKKELLKLKKQEDRLNKAYSVEAFTLEQLTEYATPIKKQISELETRIRTAEQKENSAKPYTIPTKEQIMTFAKIAWDSLQNLNFEEKRVIIIRAIDKVIGTQQQLLVSGRLPLNLEYVTLRSKRGNRGSAQCGQIHTV